MKKSILTTTLAFVFAFAFSQVAPVDTCASDTVQIVNPATIGPIPPRVRGSRPPAMHQGILLHVIRETFFE